MCERADQDTRTIFSGELLNVDIAFNSPVFTISSNGHLETLQLPLTLEQEQIWKKGTRHTTLTK